MHFIKHMNIFVMDFRDREIQKQTKIDKIQAKTIKYQVVLPLP